MFLNTCPALINILILLYTPTPYWVHNITIIEDATPEFAVSVDISIIGNIENVCFVESIV